MHQPIWLIEGGRRPVDELAAEILRCEGYPWFETQAAATVTAVPPEVRLLVVAGEALEPAQVEPLLRAVVAGTPLIALSPQPALAAALGLRFSAPHPPAHLVVEGVPDWPHGPLPLLCPGTPGHVINGGEALATLTVGGKALGPGVASARLGAGRAWLWGVDLALAIATLRHGTGEITELPNGIMGPLAGPRHLYSFFELSEQLPRDYPVADLLQDLARLLVEQALAGKGVPRLWHFPAGAPALWFIKSDGCGEPGLETLIEVAERGGGLVSYYRPPQSRYPGALLREYAGRGHGFSIEADINDLTQETVTVDGQPRRRSRPVDELNAEWLPKIRSRLEAHRDSLVEDMGAPADTVCIHSCQWTGTPMAEMVLELGWYTPTHFASHDPRMRRAERYGPYMIATALPLRYYDHAAGVLDLWHMPAQWDESQTLGAYDRLVQAPPPDWPGWESIPPAYHGFYQALAPDRARGIIGLTGAEYGAVLTEAAQAAVTRWHGVQICNFHPLYVAGPQDHPRASRQALEIGMASARAAGCRFENLENWSRFFRARAAVQLTARWDEPDAHTLTLTAPQAVNGLTVLLPPEIVSAQRTDTGARLPLHTWLLEGRTQYGLVLDLDAGQALTLRLTRATGITEHG